MGEPGDPVSMRLRRKCFAMARPYDSIPPPPAFGHLPQMPWGKPPGRTEFGGGERNKSEIAQPYTRVSASLRQGGIFDFANPPEEHRDLRPWENTRGARRAW